MRRFGSLVLPLALALCAAMPVSARKRAPDPNRLADITVQDLHFGDVLFHFYAEDDFEALTRLLAYEQWGRMPHHEHDAQLLAGGLYLGQGMHNEAGERFERLLTPEIPVGVRNQAWFYLAKIWYARGYLDRADTALTHISGALATELEAERVHLRVNVLMRQGRWDEAIAAISGWQGAADWSAYLRFNLGVALVRLDRLSDADPILAAVGTLQSGSAEMLALRDKANVALGFAHLKAGQAEAARTALNRVRLNGPYTTRALLGIGWADTQLGDFQAALTPWTELHQRNLLDAAVQESYLALPYAFGRLGANAQAAQYYEAAISAYGTEQDNLDKALAELRGGQMLKTLLADDKEGAQGWFWQLKALPDSPQSRYLYALLADNDFQEGLKNYRDLTAFDQRLVAWQESMEAFDAMIATGEQANAQRLPRADALLASNRTADLVARRAEAERRLTAIETGADVAALAKAEERAQWEQVRGLEDAASALPADTDAEQERAKIKLIKGVLFWQFDATFRARDYEERRQLRALESALNEAQNRWVRVQHARASVPANLDEFAARVAALRARLEALRGRLATTAVKQDLLLRDLAAEELTAQQERLGAYEVQARFALAEVYDRAGSAADQAAPAPKAPAEKLERIEPDAPDAPPPPPGGGP